MAEAVGWTQAPDPGSSDHEPDDSEVVQVSTRHGVIRVVTLNRPHRLNAMNTLMGQELHTALSAAEEDSTIRVVVVTGAGQRAFCSGGDLKERSEMGPRAWRRQHRVFEQTARTIRNLRKPIIAAVNGVALGGGFELALNADFIIASDTASFGLPEVSRGIIPGTGGTQNLQRRLPRGPALQILMSAQSIDAHEAWRLGLVNRIVPSQELMATTEGIALSIAKNSPFAIMQAKRSARLGADQPIESALEIEVEMYERIVDHPDRAEGVAAFNAKRAPQFLDLNV